MALLPKIKVKALVSFPATVLDGVGVDVVKANGTYQFNLAFGDFAPPVGGIADPAHANALLWDDVTGIYTLVPLSVLGAGVPEAPDDGNQYGRQSLGWTPIVSAAPSDANPAMDGVAAPGASALYSRGDHVHPTDTSRAAVTALPVPATVVPLVESGAGAIGVSVKYAREDHVHPAGGGGGGSGDVIGPGSAINNNIAVFDTTTGKLIKDGGATIAALMVQQSNGFMSLSGANLILLPKYGNLLTINGVHAVIPDAGVTLAPAGLTPATLYYIYGTQAAGVVNALEASTTVPVVSTTAGSKGFKVKTGDVTRRLVGVVYIDTGPAFADTDAKRFVRSWLNRKAIGLTGSVFTGTTTSTTGAEINSAGRVQFVSLEGEVADVSAVGTAYNNTAAQSCYTFVNIDGVNSLQQTGGNSTTVNADITFSTRWVHASLAEGYHFATAVGRVTGGTGTWYNGSQPVVTGVVN